MRGARAAGRNGTPFSKHFGFRIARRCRGHRHVDGNAFCQPRGGLSTAHLHVFVPHTSALPTNRGDWLVPR